LKCPPDADFIIEGYVDPNDEMIWEGPFGDHTGYYSLPDWYPRFHITAITHKKNAVYPATYRWHSTAGRCMAWKSNRKDLFSAYKNDTDPEIVDMDMPVEGVFHNLVIAKIKKDYAGQGQKVMNAMWGAGQMMFNKILVLVDGEIKIQNYEELAKYVFKNIIPQRYLFFTRTYGCA
jgi:4-hydroxy-3-polyprenylbenzoate decarboxylase